MGRSRLTVAIAAVAATAGVASLVATRHGLALSPDSATYLSAARNLGGGRGYVDFTLRPVTVFPPGYPVLLAVGRLVGADGMNTARAVNAASLAMVVVLAFLLLRRHVERTGVLIAATASVAVSPVLLATSTFVWTETLFTAVLLAFLLAVETADQPPDAGARATRALAAAGLAAAAGFLVRYSGASLILTGVVVFTLAPAADLRARARRLTVFLVPALLVPLLWLAHNVSVASNLTGPRTARADRPLVLVVHAVQLPFGVVDAWLAPPGWPAWLRVVALGAGFLVFAAVALGMVVSRPRAQASTPRSGPDLTACSVLIVAYSGLIVTSWARAGTPIDARMLVPMVVPVVVVIAVMVPRALAMVPRPRRRAASIAATVLLAGWLAGSTAQSLALERSAPAGDYAAPSWRSGRLVRDVQGLRTTATVYTNNPWGLAYGTGREPVDLAPGHLVTYLSHRPTSLHSFTDAVECTRPVYLVWYGPVSVASRWAVSPHELAQTFRLETTDATSAGAVFRVRPRHHCPD